MYIVYKENENVPGNMVKNNSFVKFLCNALLFALLCVVILNYSRFYDSQP